jgi:hypothetical protein
VTSTLQAPHRVLADHLTPAIGGDAHRLVGCLEPVGGTGIDDHAQFPLTIDEELRKARFRRAIASCPQIGIEAEELPGIPRVIGVFERSLRIMNSQCRTRRIAPAQYLTLWCSRTIVGLPKRMKLGGRLGAAATKCSNACPV